MESVLQPLRAYEHWLAQYKRVWRGTIGTSLVNPLLYLTALGVGLGTIVDSSPNAPAGQVEQACRERGHENSRFR
jgi:lipooligosaccharide transport system permease protein